MTARPGFTRTAALALSCLLHVGLVSGLMTAPLTSMPSKRMPSVLPVELADVEPPPPRLSPSSRRPERPRPAVPVERPRPPAETTPPESPAPAAPPSPTAAAQVVGPSLLATEEVAIVTRDQEPLMAVTPSTEGAPANWMGSRTGPDEGASADPNLGAATSAGSPGEEKRPGRASAAIPKSRAPGDSVTRLAHPRGGYQVRPVYPATARALGIQGTTLLRVFVSAEGRVIEVVVERSAGHPDLDRAAAAAVGRWRFEPALRGTEPVGMWVLVPVEFHLR